MRHPPVYILTRVSKRSSPIRLMACQILLSCNQTSFLSAQDHPSPLNAGGSYAGDFDGSFIGYTICEVPGIGSQASRVFTNTTVPGGATEDIALLL